MTQNKIIGIFGALLAVVYGISTATAVGAGATFLSGTKIFPTMVIILTAVLSAVIFLQDHMGKVEGKKLEIDKKVAMTIGKCTVIFVIYTLVFEHLGYILSTTVLLMGLLSILNGGKIKQNSIISVAFSVIAYFIFSKLLAISLPPGIINF
ncbi:tripartite tricarboxylate transporter TctB family protein [uncultured Ilyobacter sp.]|uniref:tripartite tricarboxylate transporter TctB family protein n=1 Tax=uncultured Ilyobacter sp. TaxID=544433 RepID=UPI0029C794DC|nr:tripartite tricarboxylate transporter TctB family protein [uncultured Ilyobacter sp.]